MRWRRGTSSVERRASRPATPAAGRRPGPTHGARPRASPGRQPSRAWAGGAETVVDAAPCRRTPPCAALLRAARTAAPCRVRAAKACRLARGIVAPRWRHVCLCRNCSRRSRQIVESRRQPRRGRGGDRCSAPARVRSGRAAAASARGRCQLRGLPGAAGPGVSAGSGGRLATCDRPQCQPCCSVAVASVSTCRLIWCDLMQFALSAAQHVHAQQRWNATEARTGRDAADAADCDLAPSESLTLALPEIRIDLAGVDVTAPRLSSCTHPPTHEQPRAGAGARSIGRSRGRGRGGGGSGLVRRGPRAHWAHAWMHRNGRSGSQPQCAERCFSRRPGRAGWRVEVEVEAGRGRRAQGGSEWRVVDPGDI